jgi:3-mercaptopyruvate sulfurtransferase SseA
MALPYKITTKKESEMKKRMYGLVLMVLTMLAASLLAGCGSSVTEKRTEASAYVDATLVTDSATLKASLGKANTVIIDARSASAFNAGHIPGAINAIWQSFATVGTGAPGDANWGVLKSPAEIGTALGNMGIDASTEVIVYASAPNGWGEDGRILWMLRMAGVTNSKLLNGGVTGWTATGNGLTTAATPAPTPKTFSLSSFIGDYVVDKNWILANMNRADVKIIDARDPEEYAGAIKYGEKRGGHLPGAINLPFNTALYTNAPANPGILKSQDELEALFTSAGIKKTDTIICYCTKGIRSGLMSIVLRMAGYSKAVNYDASFYDWAGDATAPVTAYSDLGIITFAGVLNSNLASTVVLDARSAADYAAGHIPGAINVMWQTFATVATGSPGDAGWGVLKPASEIGALLGSLGIDSSKEVAVYAGAPAGWGEDGRIVWMLRMAGITKARILNGGYQAWLSGGYAVNANSVTPVSTPFTLASLDTTYNVDKAWIVDNKTRSDVKILDVRAADEYAGAIKYGEKRGGHIPGAISLPFDKALFVNSGTIPGFFKSPEQLEATFSSVGLQKSDTIVSYCTKGIRSALMTMALRMAGYTNAVNYDASFYEWAGDASLPVQ